MHDSPVSIMITLNSGQLLTDISSSWANLPFEAAYPPSDMKPGELIRLEARGAPYCVDGDLVPSYRFKGPGTLNCDERKLASPKLVEIPGALYCCDRLETLEAPNGDDMKPAEPTRL
jgi:hypothetical protein